MSDYVQTTCTDCTEDMDVLAGEMVGESRRSARLCHICKAVRKDAGMGNSILPTRLGNFAMEVELQWAIAPRDLFYRALGDREEDFARRSMFRMRDALSLVAGQGHDKSPIGHFHLKTPTLRRVMGPAHNDPNPRMNVLRQYHEALCDLAPILFKCNQGVLGISAPATSSQAQTVFKALAIGARQGWHVPADLEDAVRACEDEHMPISEREAARRLGLDRPLGGEVLG